MYKLRKHFTPRWFKTFETIAELTDELSLNTCKECHDSYGSDLDSMRYFDCGLEFTIEGIGIGMHYLLSDAEFIRLESDARYVK